VKPICVPCHRFFRAKKNGFYFTEGMPVGREVKPGTEMPERWAPYKVWVGDLYECEGCGAQVIIGVGRERIVEHYEPGFDALRHRLGADDYQVNDC
jgi:hypothetical protein